MHFVHVTDRKHHLGQGAPQPSAVLVVIDESWSFQSHGRGYACAKGARGSKWNQNRTQWETIVPALIPKDDSTPNTERTH